EGPKQNDLSESPDFLYPNAGCARLRRVARHRPRHRRASRRRRLSRGPHVPRRRGRRRGGRCRGPGCRREREGVDVLVNNAAVLKNGLFALMPDASWNLVIDTALGGTYRMTKAVMRGM